MIHSTALCIVTCDERVLFSNIYLCSFDRDFFYAIYFFGKYEIQKNQYLSRAKKMETRPLIMGDIRQVIIYFWKLGDRFDDVCLFPLMILRNN